MIPRPFRVLVRLAAVAVLTVACTAAPGAAPSPSSTTAAVGGECPTTQPAALPAGETRTVTIETDQGPIDPCQVEADLLADRRRQLRGTGRMRLLRRRRVPPARARVRDPGRRPGRDRDGRPRLHDPGRAGHRPSTGAVWWRWPAPASRIRSARSSSSCSTMPPARPWPRTTRTRSSARDRPAWRPPTRSQPMPNSGGRNNAAVDPVRWTEVTVTNP